MLASTKIIFIWLKIFNIRSLPYKSSGALAIFKGHAWPLWCPIFRPLRNNIFLISLITKVIIYHLSFFYVLIPAFNIADPSSKQEACHMHMNVEIAWLTDKSLWLSGKAAECRIRRFEVWFLMRLRIGSLSHT